MSEFNLIIVRHGQSLWNQENRFTGWTDIDLSPRGIEEAEKAGSLIKKHQFFCDIAFTSVLKRAVRTLWIILENTDQKQTPVIKSWRLNERHYGRLTGLNKDKVKQEYGENQLKLWRRDFKTAPPLLSAEEVQSIQNQYKNIPLGESLQQTQERVLPLWEEKIAPAIGKKQKVLITAHGNSLRALIKHIEDISDEDISYIEIPTAQPMAYQLAVKDLSIKIPRTILK